MPYKAGPGQQLPMCPSQLSKVLPQHEVSIWPESQVTYLKGNPGLPSSPTLWPFQQIQGPWGKEGYLGKEWGWGKQRAKPLRSRGALFSDSI